MRFLKSIFIVFLGIMLSTLGGIGNTKVLANEKIESGIYEIKNDVYHDSEIGMSMARSYLNEIMELKVLGNEFEYTIGFSGTEYMENFRIVVDGEESNVDIVDENKENGTIKLKVKVPNKDSKMEARIYVGPMGRDVQFKVIPKFDTLNLIEKLEEPKEEVKETDKEVEEKENTTIETSEDNSSSSSGEKSNIGIYIGGGVLVVALIAGLVIAKRKK